MIDNQQKRLTAYNNRVPDIVLIALYSIAFVATAFAGFGAELDFAAVAASRRSDRTDHLRRDALIQDLGRPDAGLYQDQPKTDDRYRREPCRLPRLGPARGRPTNAEADPSKVGLWPIRSLTGYKP